MILGCVSDTPAVKAVLAGPVAEVGVELAAKCLHLGWAVVPLMGLKESAEPLARRFNRSPVRQKRI